MSRLWLPILVVLLYGLATILFLRVGKKDTFNVAYPLVALLFACHTHIGLLVHFVYKDGQMLDLSIFNVLSILALVVACTSVLWLWQRKMALGGALVCFISIFLAPLPAVFVGNKPFLENASGGVLYHIGLSLIAWTFLTFAFIHGLLYSYLYNRLKRKKIRRINFASLVNLERMMMVYCLVGSAFLIASLTTGFFFVNDMLAQHLWHKTVITILAAIIYIYALYRYFIAQVHGMRLMYISFAAYGFLILGYVISNIIVQYFFSLTS